MTPSRNGNGRLPGAQEDEPPAERAVRGAAAATDTLRGENVLLAAELRGAQEELARRVSTIAELRRDLAACRDELRRAVHLRDAAEERRADLAKLHVAARALHATLDPEEVLDALQEIVINLLGSECFAVHAFDPAVPALAPLRTFGVEPGRHPAPMLGVGRVGRVVRTLEPELRDAAADRGDGEPVACVPLMAAGELVAVLAVYALLPQKEGFTGFDHELVDLLVVHAGTALQAARLHSRARAPLRPVAR